MALTLEKLDKKQPQTRQSKPRTKSDMASAHTVKRKAVRPWSSDTLKTPTKQKKSALRAESYLCEDPILFHGASLPWVDLSKDSSLGVVWNKVSQIEDSCAQIYQLSSKVIKKAHGVAKDIINTRSFLTCRKRR